MFFAQKNLLDGQGVPEASEIDHIAQVCPRHLRTSGPAARGQAGFAKFDGLTVLEDCKVPFNVELAHVSPKPYFDPSLLVPVLRFFDHRVQSDTGLFEEPLRQRWSLIGKVWLVTDEGH